MPIIIKIKRTPAAKEEIKKVLLKARRTLDGKILIADHPDMDIIILPKTNKVVTFPKEEMDDEVYETQERFFKHLTRQGVVDFDSIQGGGTFMSMEATIPDMKDGDNLQYLIYSISMFLDEDLPFYKEREEFEKEHEKRLLDPEPDEYTEHDPQRFHHDVKGTLRPNMRPYGISTIYRI
tara:strand:- start:810 stop:1346 length:537 start_codon:yes stop_codon:yes gene_type:complete